MCFLHEANLLFDTGEDADKLGHNLRALNISPQAIKRVFLSHGHFDHTRGLTALRETQPEVLVLPGLLDPVQTRHLLECGFKLSDNHSQNNEIRPGLQRLTFSTGACIEQALMIKGGHGWSIIFGCAHGGVDHWIEKASSYIDKPIDLVMGGFHLIGVQHRKIRNIVDQFQKLGVQRVAPCHCTGLEALKYFQEAFGEKCLQSMVGDQVYI
ncbi:MAG: MBL fold metallo-hydrolase [Deltaproteobacteria bacterium]|nr:MBL fold metallo-hydrolase [Deltaproteobacteria bacterium]